MSDQPVKPVRYDDNAVSYGAIPPQTVEVASGVLSSVGGGIVVQSMPAGVASAAVVAGQIQVDFVQPHPLPYQVFAQLNNVQALPNATLLERVTRTPTGFSVRGCTLAGVGVDLATIPWELWFSVRVAA